MASWTCQIGYELDIDYSRRTISLTKATRVRLIVTSRKEATPLSLQELWHTKLACPTVLQSLLSKAGLNPCLTDICATQGASHHSSFLCSYKIANRTRL
jgi:hypothetical protein